MTASPRPTAASLDAPPFATAWAVLACVLAAMTLGYPALSGGFLVSPVSDQYIAGYPFREFAAASLRAGEGFPLWNPYLFGGMPYVAAMHGDIFYPTFLLRLVLPTDVAMTWGMILHLMLAGIAGYGFLRVIGVGFYASLVGGIAYMMGGQVASLVSPGHDGKLFVSALLPVTLIVLTYGIRDAKQWAWGALAIVVGLGVLSPHPQLLQYLLLASGAWALLLAFVGDGTTPAPARGVAVQRLAIALGAVVLGGAIGAIQYLPVREYVDWSPRTGGRDYEYATSFSMPIEELINTYLPQFSGILDKYWGRNGIHLHSEYIGAGVLFLMVLGFAARRVANRRALTWFWVGTGLVSLFWALGGNTPFYHLVYAIVPGSKFFRAPSTIFFVTTFAVSVLTAFGVERLLRGEVRSTLAGLAAGLGLMSVVFAYAGVIESIALSVEIPQLLEAVRAMTIAGDLAKAEDLSRYIAGKEDSIRANTEAVVAGAWRSFAFLAATGGFALLVHRRLLAARVAGPLLVIITVADLWSVQRLYWTFSPPAAQTYASDEAIVRIQQEKEPVRVITAAIGVPGAYHDPNLEGDGLMRHQVRVALGYHGNELGRYQQLGGKARNWDQISNPAFWGLMNVKYLYTTLDSLSIAGATRVVGPVRSAAGSTVYLFELPGEHAYAWVVPTVAKYPDAEVAEAVRAPNFPYKSVALLDPSSATAAEPLTAIPEPLAIRAVVDSFAPGYARLTLDAPAPAGSALVVSENFYPGWTATIDGKPATVERADLSLMAVTLPAGARTIELTFDSAPYHTGKRVTIIAGILALLLMAVGFFVRPRGMAHA